MKGYIEVRKGTALLLLSQGRNRALGKSRYTLMTAKNVVLACFARFEEGLGGSEGTKEEEC